MKIEYIKVRGAIGFKKGLSVDELEFDFTNKTGLVALSGPNGRGKTTLLELMSPYRTFASRKGALQNHFFLRDSFIETKFLYNGDRYQTIRKIDSESDRAEAFIIKNDESVVNGKLKEYDKYIVDLFGSQTLFYNSVFCAQGSGNLSDMTTGKIKELFVEFLRIERLAEYETQAKTGVGYCQKKLDVLAGEIKACNDSIDKLNTGEFELKELKTNLLKVEKEIIVIDSEIKDIDSFITDLEKKKVTNQINIDKKDDAIKNLKELESKQFEIKSKIDKLSAEYEGKKYEYEKELNLFEQMLKLKPVILKADSDLNNLKEIGEHFSDCFECTVSEQDKLNIEKKTVEEIINKIKDTINDFETDPEVSLKKAMTEKIEVDINKFEANLVTIGRTIKELNNDIMTIRLTDRCDVLVKEMSLSVDPECLSQACPALEKIELAKKQLPKVIKELEGRKEEINNKLNLADADIKKIKLEIISSSNERDSIQLELSKIVDENKKVIADLKIDYNEYSNKQMELVCDGFELKKLKEFYKQALNDAREAYKSLSDLAGKKQELEILESKKESLKEKFTTESGTYSERKSDLEDEPAKLIRNIFDIKNEIAEICSSIVNDIDYRINAFADQKKKLNTTLKIFIDSAGKFKNQVAVLENKVLEKKELEKSLSLKQNTESIIKKELSEWEYLRLACSKTGLQALEIDGAAPLITTEANALLSKAFGLDSQIKIITQDPESGREVFWIKVIREDGAEDDFGNLSGGQQVWIAQALNLGMTLVSNRKSGRDFKTLFADEKDGALDREKALEFIQLYRAMMVTGKFETCFYISHNPDVVALADHEVKF